MVFAKPVVQGAADILEYLGRYVHKTAVADHAITALDDRNVTFRYRDSRTRESKLMTLPAEEFLRRFLQHVPQKGFHRVRAFGLLHPAHRSTLRQLQLMLAARGDSASRDAEPRPRLRRPCPRCRGADLVMLRRLTPDECASFTDALLPHARAPP